jgi:Uma2 family endonuclease
MMRVYMFDTDEIVLPETKPETEWLAGRAVRKMSPFYTHGAVQSRIVKLLEPWAAERGRVATEWRFRLAPPGAIRRPLVPDVSYLSYARLARDAYDEADAPAIPPDAAFEVLSKSSRPGLVRAKIEVLLECGTPLVVIVEPRDWSVTLHDGGKPVERRGGDAFRHAALPGFETTARAFFERLPIPPPR